MSVAIELKNITKIFPGVIANNNISFQVEKGEIHALAGENGAGKSTLMNIIFGLLKPDKGELYVSEKKVEFNSPSDSINEKIGMVHQHFMLIPKLTVLDNVIIGDEPGSKIKIDRASAAKKIQEISDKYQLNIDPYKRIGDLSVPEQQRVEIIKVLYREAEILIFDEPTAVLPPALIEEFCNILLGLKKQGKTIIFISHKLAEVMAISDRVTVLRLGEVIGTRNINEIDVEELTYMMVGRSIDLGRKDRKNLKFENNVLDIQSLNYTNFNGKQKLNNLSLSVNKGEIVGIAGVDGNGQEELEKCILGIVSPDSGTIKINDVDIVKKSVRERKELGLAYVAEDRHKESLVLQTSVAENLILGQHYHEEFAKNGFWLNYKKVAEHAKTLQKDFDIRCANVAVKSGTLSGGNQQKIVIAREAYNNPEIFVAIQPTRGLDIGASESVQNTLMDIRNNGKGVLLISMELDEILAVSDRVAVIFEGEIITVLDGSKTNKEELGMYMLGQHKR